MGQPPETTTTDPPASTGDETPLTGNSEHIDDPQESTWVDTTTTSTSEPGWTTLAQASTSEFDDDTTSSMTADPGPVCGDGNPEPGEECDDGNTIHYDQCSNLCHDNWNSGCDSIVPLSLDCDPGLYCVSDGLCAGCQTFGQYGLTCADDINDNKPACHAETGACIECTPQEDSYCKGQTDESFCNPVTLQCAGCYEHSQCVSGVCEYNYWSSNEGECTPPAPVAWVEQQADCTDKTGSLQAPFCTISEVLQSPVWMDEYPLVIRVRSGIKPQPSFSWFGWNTVIVIGDSEDEVEFPVLGDPEATAPIVNVVSGQLQLSRLRIAGSTAIAADGLLHCDGDGGLGTLVLDRTIVTGNSGGLDTFDCDVMIHRSRITSNTAGSRFYGSSVYIGNSFITDNLVVKGGAPLLATNGTNLNVNFSTIAGNSGTYASTIGCDAQSGVHIGRSVLLYQDDSAPKCEDEFKSIEDSLELDISAKDDVFVSSDEGVYRVDDGSLAKDVAPIANYYYLDYDGDPRTLPTDYAGADRPKP